jgi:hypothetical protein
LSSNPVRIVSGLAEFLWRFRDAESPRMTAVPKLTEPRWRMSMLAGPQSEARSVASVENAPSVLFSA